jgi:hypothetical protein
MDRAAVRSPLNYTFWQEQLKDHPDKKLVKRLLQQIREGISIGYQGNEFFNFSPNWPSADKYKDSVHSNIVANAAKGRLDGPFRTPPHPFFRASPLGAFPKKRSGKIRVIHDLSWPPGENINEFINKHDYTFSFSTIDAAVQRCLKYATPYMVKLDITDAYMHCMIRPEERHLLGFSWESNGIREYWQYAVLPFGLSSSPKLFNDYADALRYIMINRGASQDTLHYLDDFWSVCGNESDASSNLNIMSSTIKESGMEIQESKTVGPTRIIEYLGIIIDTISWQVKISDERLCEIREDLFAWRHKSVCTKRQLLSLIGKLMFCASVVRDGRKFVGRLIDLSKRIKYLHHRVKLNRQARADINWWLHSMESHNGTSMIPMDWGSSDIQYIYTDASNLAAAGVCDESWCMVPFSGDNSWMAAKTIAWRELFAVVMCIATFGSRLSGRKLAMYTDNQVVLWCINKGKSHNTDLMGLIRALYYYTTVYKIDYKAFYVNTKDNIIADALSRLKYDVIGKFRVGVCETPVPSIVLDF